MSPIKVIGGNLFNIADVDFVPEAPRSMEIDEKANMSFSILTATTGYERKLVRCNEHGAILVGNPWDNMSVVASDQLVPSSGSPDSWTRIVENKAVMICTSTYIIKCEFVRISGGGADTIYLPPQFMFFYPHPTYSVTVSTVPDPGGSASYVGLMSLTR